MRASSPRPTILLVDDDAALRVALKFSLELEGFAVETFESGEALLLRGVPAGPTCLVLDYKLGGIDGLETLQQLRARGFDTPAVIVTGHLNPAVRQAIATAGATIVYKPLMGDALVGEIRAALP